MAGNKADLDQIKNIIFDFGGVIINIDHKRVEKAFGELGLQNFDRFFSQANQSGIFRDFEKGLIGPTEFHDGIRKLTGLNIRDHLIDQIWNQIIGNYPLYHIELLKKIRKNYRLFLLSNTNQIHYRYYTRLFKTRFGYELENLFDGTYWSFKIGRRKPDPDPYLFLIQNEHLESEHTLFIDDSIQNIITARELRILAYHLKDGVDVTSLFNGVMLDNSILNKM